MLGFSMARPENLSNILNILKHKRAQTTLLQSYLKEVYGEEQ
jgi:hypothetical protein